MYLLVPITQAKADLFYFRQLCVHLNAEDIYRRIAQILSNEPNLKFVSTMIESLNVILLTAPELFELRMRLKELKTAVSNRSI